MPFVDGMGFLHLFARENIPVTAVTAVQIKDLLGANTWTSLSFVSDDVVLPPGATISTRPDSAHVYLKPSVALNSRTTGQIQARWTYSGGYTTIPTALKNTICRLAWYIYKLRDAPMYQTMIPSMGIMQMPIAIPKDILTDADLWKPSYA
jgi:hypothetical protein